MSPSELSVVDGSVSVVAGNVLYIMLYPCRSEDVWNKTTYTYHSVDEYTLHFTPSTLFVLFAGSAVQQDTVQQIKQWNLLGCFVSSQPLSTGNTPEIVNMLTFGTFPFHMSCM